MKQLFLAFMLFISMSTNAQSVVSFKLAETGSFVAEDGKDFVVVPFEGKTAHQIFQQLSVNANALYKNPSKVVSVVDDASISIRAFDDQISFEKDLIQKFWLTGYYNLNFEIKDGRVKVSGPIIESVSRATSTYDKDFSKMVRGWFKNGELKDKFKAQVEYTEDNMNNLINAILGSTKKKAEEDW